MAAIAAIGGLIAGGSNMISSLGSTAIQAGTSMALQSHEQSYNSSVMDRVEKAYTSVGLPKFMAYSGGANNSMQLPGQQFHVRGSNFYSSGLVGQNVPFLSTPYQTYTHTGRPSESTNNSYNAVPPWNEPGENNEMSNLSGNTSYMNLPINRAFMSQLNSAGTGEMSRMPTSIFTRTNFNNNTVLNHQTSDRNVDAHRTAANLLA
jgi:hypothetical protein